MKYRVVVKTHEGREHLFHRADRERAEIAAERLIETLQRYDLASGMVRVSIPADSIAAVEVRPDIDPLPETPETSGAGQSTDNLTVTAKLRRLAARLALAYLPYRK